MATCYLTEIKIQTLLARVTHLQVDLFHLYDQTKEQQVVKLKQQAARLGTQLALQQITRKH